MHRIFVRPHVRESGDPIDGLSCLREQDFNSGLDVFRANLIERNLEADFEKRVWGFGQTLF
ncbi:hypothetical protein [Nevskia soli]|uniref:hypothetical protein n=1 Tax=Nevskia soli TaxID=418856 RepID=UPI00214D7DFB|nr:hypothetical protein [Nevskia soli]